MDIDLKTSADKYHKLYELANQRKQSVKLTRQELMNLMMDYATLIDRVENMHDRITYK